MRRVIYAVIGVAGLTGCGIWTYTQWYVPNSSEQHMLYGTLQPDRPVWIQLPVIAVLFVVGAGFVAESFSSNIYRVYEGNVIGRKFIPEHINPAYTYPMLIGKVMIMQRVPATHVPDKFMLQLRRHDGRTGWLSVNKTAYDTADGQYIDLRPKR